MAQERPDYEAFFRAWGHLKALAFYLNPEQCASANTAREALEQDRGKLVYEGPEGASHITKIGWTPFKPNADMNSSYYLNTVSSEIAGTATVGGDHDDRD